MALFNIILTVISGLLAIPALIFFLEIVLSLLYRRRAALPQGSRPSVAVLMPAHDEAGGIAQSLHSVLPQLRSTDRLVVIADNCTDDTASVAAAAGAEVIERRDPARRGKGFALDYGVRYLEHDPRAVVIIADADCVFSADSIDRLARQCQRTGRPVQALYLMQAPAGAGTRVRIAQFAWTVKNWARPTGLLAAALPCHLMGTGMAFSWNCIRSAQLASGHIVEDMQLGLDLARRGEAPDFCPDARVTSSFPGTEEGVRSQRTRWEHGHLGVITTGAAPLLLSGLRRRDVRAIALSLDLIVPPLALFVMLAVLVALLDAVLVFLHGGSAPLVIATVTLALVGLSIMLAWLRYGRDIVSLYALASAPVYALLKLPIYAGFLVARQLDWVRSKRDP